jgi:hypothetical protein
MYCDVPRWTVILCDVHFNFDNFYVGYFFSGVGSLPMASPFLLDTYGASCECYLFVRDRVYICIVWCTLIVSVNNSAAACL